MRRKNKLIANKKAHASLRVRGLFVEQNMGPKIKLILYFGIFGVSAGLSILAVFFWKDPMVGTWEYFFNTLCFEQMYLVLGLDGVLRARRQKAERGYAQPGSFISWLMVGFFCLALARNFYVLFS
jgi:hypothetical protein